MRSKTKTKILQAALELFATHPQASLDEVALKADVSRATTYRYFPSRHALVYAVFEHTNAVCNQAITPLFLKGLLADKLLYEVLEVLIPLGNTMRLVPLAETFSHDEAIQALWDKQREEWRELIEWLKTKGIVDPAISTPWAMRVLDTLLFTTWEAIDAGELAPKEAPSLLHRTFLEGLGSRP